MGRLAWRNLWRNRTRTLLALAAVGLSLGLQLISHGVAEYGYGHLLDSARRVAGGDLLVEPRGWWASRDPTQVIARAAEARSALQHIAGVRVVLPRILLTGLASSARSNAGVQLTAIDPQAERHLTDYARRITKGQFLAAHPSRRRPGIVLGKGIVDRLGLKLGDRVVLTAAGVDGEVARGLFVLRGVYATGSRQLDDLLAFARLDDVQRVFAYGDRVVQFGVILGGGADRARVRAAIHSTLGDHHGPLEILAWEEAMPDLVDAIRIDRSMSDAFGYAIFLVVAFGVANAFLMSVLERTRELGLLSALGMTPAATARMLLLEATLIGVTGLALGLGLGLTGHWALNRWGIDVGAIAGVKPNVGGVVVDDMVLHSRIVWTRWARTCAVVWVIVVLAGSWPALRAARFNPAEAMRSYE